MKHLSQTLAQTGARLALREEFQAHNSMSDTGIDHSIFHAGGLHVDNIITCDQNGATLVNVFTVTGSIKGLKIYARCITEREAPNVTFNTVYFDVLDSNAGQDDITLAAGVNCNTIKEKALIIKQNLSTVAATFVNSDQSRIVDPALSEVYAPFIIVPYSVDGISTIRFCYTGDANTDLDMHVHLRYVPFGNATVVAI